MASGLKQKIIAGCWVSIGGTAAYKTYRHIQEFEERAPCLRDAELAIANSGAARAILGAGELSMARWPRNRSLDPSAGQARASFEVRGDQGSVHVVMGAKRRQQAQEAWQKDTDEEADEEDELGSGWYRYWSRPWELKGLVMSKFQGFGAREEVAPKASEGEEEQDAWDLETLFFMPKGSIEPTVLMGNAAAMPEYEAMCLRRDAESKGAKSQRRLQVVFGLAAGGAMLAGGLRMAKSFNVSKSYGYVQRSLLAHSEVVGALGQGIRLQSSSGTFGASYINARLRLISEGGKGADVEVAALREGGSSSPWRVVLARMKSGGFTRNLDLSQF